MVEYIRACCLADVDTRSVCVHCWNRAVSQYVFLDRTPSCKHALTHPSHNSSRYDQGPVALPIPFAHSLLTFLRTWNIVHISIWSALEIHVGFWVACFPAFVPLIRRAYNKVFLGSSNHGPLPVFDAVRSPGARPRKKPQGFTSTGDATASEDGIMTNADGTVRTSMNLELADAKTWTHVRAGTAETNEDALSHDGPMQLQSRDGREPV